MGGLLLFGLFVAALSSVLGGLVGPPRVLQRIAEDNVLPILKPFAQLVGTIGIIYVIFNRLYFVCILYIMYFPYLLTVDLQIILSGAHS